MGLLSFLLILTTAGATGGDTRQPYVIEYKDHSKNTLYGFWDERGKQSGGWVRVELDTPWDPVKQWETIQESTVDVTKERASATEKRRKEGYAAAKLVLVNEVPIPQEQFDLAQRARKMAGLDVAEAEGEPGAIDGPTAPPTDVIDEEPNDEAPQLGFFEQWGAHIGLLLVAVLLTGLVVRMTFLSRD